MRDLKEAISTKCMAYFNINWETEIICDASPVGLGAVLCQYNQYNQYCQYCQYNNILLLGRSRSSGIPQFVQPFNALNLKEIHAYARRNHEVATARMKDEYDARMRVNQSNIDIGSLVLIKLKNSQKSTPIWDPDPYKVIGINGTQITASRHDRTTTRNSSFFKLFRYDDDEGPGSNTIPNSANTAVTANPPAIAELTPNFNIFDPVVELDAAHQRQVSFNEDIVIINDQGNTPFVEPQPIATPAVELFCTDYYYFEILNYFNNFMPQKIDLNIN